jgi:hypothetical protein
VNSNWPGVSRARSAACGSLTLTIICAFAQTSDAVAAIVAPARA